MKVRKFLFLPVLMAAIFAAPLLLSAGAAFASEHDIEELEEEIQEKAKKLLKDADALFKEGELEDLKKVVEVYEEVLADLPDNFESNWKIARGCRFYADLAKRLEVPDWEDICAEYGKKGMKYAKKAIELEPERPEGYFYYGLCAGSYSDGVGLITALREGLRSKTQDNLEKAYEIDKNLAEGGPMVALGRFWQVVPWPYNDKEKAMEYYREFEESRFFDRPGTANARVWMAEILMDRRGSEPKQEARSLLEKAVELAEDPYWKNQARELLEEF